MTGGHFDGGFIDSDDREAMEAWAHGMSRGMKLDQAAAVLKVDATIEAVAAALVGNCSDDPDTRAATVRICEAELREANRSTT